MTRHRGRCGRAKLRLSRERGVDPHGEACPPQADGGSPGVSPSLMPILTQALERAWSYRWGRSGRIIAEFNNSAIMLPPTSARPRDPRTGRARGAVTPRLQAAIWAVRQRDGHLPYTTWGFAVRSKRPRVQACTPHIQPAADSPMKNPPAGLGARGRGLLRSSFVPRTSSLTSACDARARRGPRRAVRGWLARVSRPGSCALSRRL